MKSTLALVSLLSLSSTILTAPVSSPDVKSLTKRWNGWGRAWSPTNPFDDRHRPRLTPELVIHHLDVLPEPAALPVPVTFVQAPLRTVPIESHSVPMIPPPPSQASYEHPPLLSNDLMQLYGIEIRDRPIPNIGSPSVVEGLRTDYPLYEYDEFDHEMNDAVDYLAAEDSDEESDSEEDESLEGLIARVEEVLARGQNEIGPDSPLEAEEEAEIEEFSASSSSSGEEEEDAEDDEEEEGSADEEEKQEALESFASHDPIPTHFFDDVLASDDEELQFAYDPDSEEDQEEEQKEERPPPRTVSTPSPSWITPPGLANKLSERIAFPSPRWSVIDSEN